MFAISTKRRILLKNKVTFAISGSQDLWELTAESSAITSDWASWALTMFRKTMNMQQRRSDMADCRVQRTTYPVDTDQILSCPVRTASRSEPGADLDFGNATTVLQSRLFDSSRTCADGMFLIGSRGHAWRTASSRRSRVWQQAHLLSKRDATTNQTFHFIKDLRTAPGKWHIRKRINAKWDCRCQNAWSYVKSISYQRKFLLIDSTVTFGETNYLNDVVTFIIFQCLSSPAQTKWAYSQLPPLRKCLLFFVYHYLAM